MGIGTVIIIVLIVLSIVFMISYIKCNDELTIISIIAIIILLVFSGIIAFSGYRSVYEKYPIVKVHKFKNYLLVVTNEVYYETENFNCLKSKFLYKKQNIDGFKNLRGNKLSCTDIEEEDK
jgi:heme/copper-type cytochrome/quinol oxidase subunit 2